MTLPQLLILIRHLCLSEACLGVDVRIDIKMTCVVVKLDCRLKFVNYSRSNGQHKWDGIPLERKEGRKRIFAFVMNKIFT